MLRSRNVREILVSDPASRDQPRNRARRAPSLGDLNGGSERGEPRGRDQKVNARGWRPAVRSGRKTGGSALPRARE